MTAAKQCCCRALTVLAIGLSIVLALALLAICVFAFRANEERPAERKDERREQPAPVVERRLSNAEIARLQGDNTPPPCGYRSWYEYGAVKRESQ